jgi:hypothetical protein
MTTTLPEVAAAYVRATNNHDAAAFSACFSDNAIVNDAGREFRGEEAIREWSDREIMAAQVTFEILGVTIDGGEVIVATRVDGNFDRTGLPDPLVINHHITANGNKITHLACRLAGAEHGTK